jgi:hypothetical protein
LYRLRGSDRPGALGWEWLPSLRTAPCFELIHCPLEGTKKVPQPGELLLKGSNLGTLIGHLGNDDDAPDKEGRKQDEEGHQLYH